jgi:anaerobic magnesium-protoporphyrin IX monomethyl ester cyclase
MGKYPQVDFVQVVPFQEKAAFGPRLIDSYLRHQGFNVGIIYFKRRSQEHAYPSETEIHLLLSLIEELSPLLIGVSLLSPFRNVVFDLVRRIKQKSAVPIIFGGVHATIAPEDCLQVADICCVGDGEEPLRMLLHNLKNNIKDDHIPNCLFKNGNKLTRNPMSYFNQDLDNLPFNDLSGMNKYFINDEHLLAQDPFLDYLHDRKIYDFKAYRGCPHSCTYCGNATLRKAYQPAGQYLRRRSVDHVMAELKTALQLFPFIQAMRSYDEVFFIDKAFIKEFSEKYKAEIHLPLFIDAYVTKVSEEMVTQLALAGLRNVTVGVEAFSEEVRSKIYNRPQKDEQILAGVRLFAKNHVQVDYDFICDSPYETHDDMETAFWKMIIHFPRPCNFQLYSLSHLPQTDLTRRLLQEGKISEQDIVGTSDKALVQWKVSSKKSRDPRVQFWIDMLTLYALPIPLGRRALHVPKFVIASVAKLKSSRILKILLSCAFLLRSIGDGSFPKKLKKKLFRVAK